MAGTGRRTSVEVYHRIEKEGLLSKQRFAIYKVLYEQGPMTISECFEVLARNNPNFNWNTRTRFGELRDQQAIYEVRERKCKVTGEVVIEWDVTDSFPVKLEKGRSPLSKRSLKKLQDIWHRVGDEDREAIDRVMELVSSSRVSELSGEEGLSRAHARKAREDFFAMSRAAIGGGFKMRHQDSVRAVFQHIEFIAGDAGSKCELCGRRLARTYDGMWCPEHGVR